MSEEERGKGEAPQDRGEGRTDVTEPGDWERSPADEEDLRHDDSSEPLAEPLGDDADDDLAEQEAGDVSADENEGFDRPDAPDEAEVDEAGHRLEEHGEPLFQGSQVPTPVGSVPSRSLVAMGAFIVVFCAVFFGLWGLLGNLGIFLGLFAGTALGLGAMKLLADRGRTA